ncbi:Ig-like domain-containing protein [Rhodococcus sp. X156]|uniref:L,D-transpeptidase n=1 Tax=Rhodococcus sp. X156 TaxID=2499145 RepID=UPI001F498413|nr:Ig-like domain-containing protein [Rhodococcus sp. X156]
MTSWWRRLPALAMLLVVLTGCTAAPLPGTGPADGPAPSSAAVTVPVTQAPAAGAQDVLPTTPVSVSVLDGTLHEVVLSSSTGATVSGVLDPAGRTWTAGEALGYGNTYTWSGTASDPAGHTSAITGSFRTLAPRDTTSAQINIGDDAVVGIAAPIVVQFSDPVADKATAERGLSVRTSVPTEGSWAWLPDTAEGSRAHWRPKAYFTPGTVVDVGVTLYGVDLGGGSYGSSDLTSHFTIGRSQVVKADAASHRLVVLREGAVLFDFPVSYGKGDLPRNVTRSGVHVVTEKLADVLMTNIPAGYQNVREKWAVRISNNGEFIHANPNTVGVQGAANVSNGCINESLADAEKYFHSAMFGDPVEVTNTSIPLSAADGDIYDWALTWPQWQQLSAL